MATLHTKPLDGWRSVYDAQGQMTRNKFQKADSPSWAQHNFGISIIYRWQPAQGDQTESDILEYVFFPFLPALQEPEYL